MYIYIYIYVYIYIYTSVNANPMSGRAHLADGAGEDGADELLDVSSEGRRASADELDTSAERLCTRRKRHATRQPNSIAYR